MKPDEHDTLITLVEQQKQTDKKLSSLCNKVDSIHNKLDQQKMVCFNNVKGCSDRFLQNRHFYWAVGVLGAMVLLVGGLSWENYTFIREHADTIHKLTELKEIANVIKAYWIDPGL